MIDEMLRRSDVGDILSRALAGDRLTAEDGARLFASKDGAAIGAAAHIVRLARVGPRTFYVVNRHINYTDICKNRCAFCAYSRSEGEDGAYAMTLEEVLRCADDYWSRVPFTELHIVGGLHPSLPFSYYIDMLSALHERFPGVHLQAFTAVEIEHLSRIADLSIAETLLALKEAGLDSMPGGGAEIFAERVRAIVCPEKLPGELWLDVARQAHRLGIRSNATMLYGHVETDEERVDHMLRIRDLQDETGGFLSFIPLKFHAANTKLEHLGRPMSSQENLRVYSVARLLLDNVDHIKVFWIMQGIKLAQVALSYGADDFDGTVVEEKITHRAGAETPEGLAVEDIRRLIEETGTAAVERDTVYNEVTRDEAGMPAISKR